MHAETLTKIRAAGLSEATFEVPDRVLVKGAKARIWHLDAVASFTTILGRAAGWAPDPCPTARRAKDPVTRAVSPLDIAEEDLRLCTHQACQDRYLDNSTRIYQDSVITLAERVHDLRAAISERDLQQIETALPQLIGSAGIARSRLTYAQDAGDETPLRAHWEALVTRADELVDELTAAARAATGPDSAMRRAAAAEVNLRRHELPAQISYDQGRTVLGTWQGEMTRHGDVARARRETVTVLSPRIDPEGVAACCDRFTAVARRIIAACDPQPRVVLARRGFLGSSHEANDQLWPHARKGPQAMTAMPELIADRFLEQGGVETAGVLGDDVEDPTALLELAVALWDPQSHGPLARAEAALAAAANVLADAGAA